MASMGVIWANWGYSGSHAGHEATWGCQCTNAILETKESIWLNPQAASILLFGGRAFWTPCSLLSLNHDCLLTGNLFTISNWFSPTHLQLSQHWILASNAWRVPASDLQWFYWIWVAFSVWMASSSLRPSRKRCLGHAHCKNKLFIPSTWIKSCLNI